MDEFHQDELALRLRVSLRRWRLTNGEIGIVYVNLKWLRHGVWLWGYIGAGRLGGSEITSVEPQVDVAETMRGGTRHFAHRREAIEMHHPVAGRWPALFE